MVLTYHLKFEKCKPNFKLIQFNQIAFYEVVHGFKILAKLLISKILFNFTTQWINAEDRFLT